MIIMPYYHDMKNTANNEAKQSECGYKGHVCGRNNEVQFISRFRDQNDYCVGGERVSIYDDGRTRNATPENLAAIRLFELRKYAEYCQWHVEFKARHGEFAGELQPFSFAA